VCITFVWFSAPDLALTQLVGGGGDHRADPAGPALAAQAADRRSVATAQYAAQGTHSCAARDFLLATVAGGGMALLSYAMMTRQTPKDISPSS
jgi:multicomponent K+:H+ antiporter subunit A